jgi:hypothetical protein
MSKGSFMQNKGSASAPLDDGGADPRRLSQVLASASSSSSSAGAAEQLARLNKLPCDGQHFGWFCETINAMLTKQSFHYTFVQIQLGACIFAKFPEASAHMRELVCAVLIKACSTFRPANLHSLVWALRSLWKLGSGSSNLKDFSIFLAKHAAVHADAAAPLMLSHHRHHVFDALYYNLVAIQCLMALSMRIIDRTTLYSEDIQLPHRSATRELTDDMTQVGRVRNFSRSISYVEDTQVNLILQNIKLRALTCVKLLGHRCGTPMEEEGFLAQLLDLQCVAVPIRLQDATLIHQPLHVLLPLGASIVFKSSIKLAVPLPILQVRSPPPFPYICCPLRTRLPDCSLSQFLNSLSRLCSMCQKRLPRIFSASPMTPSSLVPVPFVQMVAAKPSVLLLMPGEDQLKMII